VRTFSGRGFLKPASMFVAPSELLLSAENEVHANPFGLPVGCQTWPVRSMIAKDFPGTLKQLATTGFQSIEMCSPVGYADSGFGDLRKYSGKGTAFHHSGRGPDLRTRRVLGPRPLRGSRIRPCHS
jgi:hypothetical protein